jgi:hypothetical protein
MALTDGWIMGMHLNGNLTESAQGLSVVNNGVALLTTPAMLGSHFGRWDGSDLMTIGSASDLNPVGAITIAMVVRASGNASGFERILSKVSADNNSGWNVLFIGGAKTPYFNLRESGASKSVFASTDCRDGNPHLIVCVCDLIKQKIFVDNVLEGIRDNTVGVESVSDVALTLGRDSRAAANYYIGDGDEYNMWDRALTDGGVTTVGNSATGEIAALWNGGNFCQVNIDCPEVLTATIPPHVFQRAL